MALPGDSSGGRMVAMAALTGDEERFPIGERFDPPSGGLFGGLNLDKPSFILYNMLCRGVRRPLWSGIEVVVTSLTRNCHGALEA